MKKTLNFKTFIGNFAVSLDTQISNMAKNCKTVIKLGFWLRIVKIETGCFLNHARARETLLRPCEGDLT